jgi:ankyrin repeat protein
MPGFLVIILCLSMTVAASTGTDFANNLFTDLGPLIALFGEQVSKQFLSQSLGLAGSVLFAMAPLGIITGVVSAIRLSGYTWLRAIVGRAAETRGAAGLELTPATSGDICELWDGNSVVRILGTPTILTVVHVRPDLDLTTQSDDTWNYSELSSLINGNSAVETDYGESMVVDFEEARKRDWFTSRSHLFMRQKTAQTRANLWDQTEDAIPPRTEELQAIPIPIPPIPPNIALNIRRRPSPRLIQIAACIVTTLQGLVLVVGGLLTFKKSINKEERRNTYGFALLVTGTFLVCSGLFLSASTVDRSSKKEYWKAIADKYGNPVVRLTWLQKTQIVNDQSFPAFAIRPNQPELLISYAEENFAHIHHRRALYGVVFSLTGFIIQFVGFRSVHWLVSISQLVAMLCATLIRVFIQLPFSKPSHCQKLIMNFELEWMAFDMSSIQNWWPQSAPTTYRIATTRDFTSHSAQVLRSRIKIGEIAQKIGWELPHRTDAMAVKDTIESFVNMLWMDSTCLTSPALTLQEFKWPFTLHRDTAWDNQSLGDIFHLTIKRQRHPGGWTNWIADLGEIEALLSLWLYHIRLNRRGTQKVSGVARVQEVDEEDGDAVNDQFIWGVVPLSAISCLDFDFWIRRSNYPFRVESDSTASLLLQYNELRGLRSPQCETSIEMGRALTRAKPSSLLAMVTLSTLPRLCGRYIVASLVRHAFQHLSYIKEPTTIRYKAFHCDDVSYENVMITELATAACQARLMNKQDALAIIVPALRERKLLPALRANATQSVAQMATIHAQLRISSAQQLLGNWKSAEDILEHTVQLCRDFTSDFLTQTQALKQAFIIEKDCVQLLTQKRKAVIETTGISIPDTGHNPAVTRGQAADGEEYHFLSKLNQLYESNKENWNEAEDFLYDFLFSSRTECTSATNMEAGTLGNSEVEGRLQESNNGSVTSASMDAVPCLDEKCPWKLCMILSYHPDKKTLRRLLDQSVQNGHPLAAMMVLMAIMNDPSLKRIRSDLKGLLYIAAAKQDTRLLEILLFYAQRPITILETESNPLSAAAKTGNSQAVVLMLRAGISPESRGLEGSTVVQIAAAEGQVELVKVLAEYGVDVDAPVAPNGMSTLAALIERDDDEAVDHILKHGANPNPPYRWYGTPLQLASKRSLSLVTQLVEAGADVNYPGPPHGFTALQTAVMANQVPTVEYLLLMGANPSASGTNRLTPLQMAIAAGKGDIADLLRNAGANSSTTNPSISSIPNAQSHPTNRSPYPQNSSCDLIPWSPLQLAASAGNEVKVASLLVTDDPNVPATILKGRTVLQAAAEEGHDAIVAALLPLSDVNAERAEIGGLTALEAACKGGHLAIVRRLLDAGADVNVRAGVEDGTALQLACIGGYADIVRLLLEGGADVNAEPAEVGGYSAVDGAKFGGWTDIVSLLEAHNTVRMAG